DTFVKSASMNQGKVDTKSTFGTKLRQLREGKKLTQGQLAKLCALSRLQIIRLEMDQQGASWATVQQLAQALGVSCEAFPEETPPAADSGPAPAKMARRRKGKMK